VQCCVFTALNRILSHTVCTKKQIAVTHFIFLLMAIKSLLDLAHV
jgi:hypothetical protein